MAFYTSYYTTAFAPSRFRRSHVVLCLRDDSSEWIGVTSIESRPLTMFQSPVRHVIQWVSQRTNAYLSRIVMPRRLQPRCSQAQQEPHQRHREKATGWSHLLRIFHIAQKKINFLARSIAIKELRCEKFQSFLTVVPVGVVAKSITDWKSLYLLLKDVLLCEQKIHRGSIFGPFRIDDFLKDGSPSIMPFWNHRLDSRQTGKPHERLEAEDFFSFFFEAPSTAL